MSKPEPLLRRRNVVLLASEPESTRSSGISLQVKSECCAGGVRREGGMNLFQAFLWNCGNQSCRCSREKPKWRYRKGESTDAMHWGGAARSSEEASVMEVEQRGCVRWFS